MMPIGEVVSATFLCEASPTAYKIDAFRKLSAGWSLGEGEAFSEQTIVAAMRLLAHLESYGYTETHAFRGLEGEILVKGYGKSDRIELIAESDGTFTFAVPGDREFLVYCEDLSENACVKQISRMVSRSRLTSESSILSTISIEETSDSLASLLGARAGYFLSSMNSAPLRRAGLYAST